MRKSSIPVAIVLAALLLAPAAAQAQAGGGCSFYGNGERELQSADRGNGFGTDGASDLWRLTTPPDVTREGRAMVDSFRTNMGRQHFDQRVTDRNISVGKPVGGTTLGSGAVARISTGRR